MHAVYRCSRPPQQLNSAAGAWLDHLYMRAYNRAPFSSHDNSLDDRNIVMRKHTTNESVGNCLSCAEVGRVKLNQIIIIIWTVFRELLSNNVTLI